MKGINIKNLHGAVARFRHAELQNKDARKKVKDTNLTMSDTRKEILDIIEKAYPGGGDVNLLVNLTLGIRSGEPFPMNVKRKAKTRISIKEMEKIL